MLTGPGAIFSRLATELSGCVWAMAAIVTVRVYGACNLPIMDHKRNTTDAYVSVEIQNTTEKVNVDETRHT